MKLIEPINGAVEKKIRTALLPAEDPLIQVSTDMDQNGVYGRVWLVATAGRVLVIPESGPDGTVDVAIQDIVRVRSEVLVGGHRLELERIGEPAISLLYSRSLGEKFAEVCRGIEQLRTGRPLRINADLDSIRCEKCNQLLPVRGGVCPACTSRVATLRRISRYLKPYWPYGLLLAVASILSSGAELLPPLITRALVDDVLVPVATDGGDTESRVRLLGLLVLGLIAIRLCGWAMEWIHGWTVSWGWPRELRPTSKASSIDALRCSRCNFTTSERRAPSFPVRLATRECYRTFSSTDYPISSSTRSLSWVSSFPHLDELGIEHLRRAPRAADNDLEHRLLAAASPLLHQMGAEVVQSNGSHPGNPGGNSTH